MDQLPYAEYGTVGRAVLRISSDLASPLRGPGGPGREPAPGAARPSGSNWSSPTPAAAEKARIPLRSGMLMNARFTLRRQRLITLVLDPLRKWLR